MDTANLLIVLVTVLVLGGSARYISGALVIGSQRSRIFGLRDL